MCRIVRGLRSAREIADEIAKRGFRIIKDDANRRWSIIPPDDATEAEIEAVSAFLVELMNQAAAAYGGKVTVTRDEP